MAMKLAGSGRLYEDIVLSTGRKISANGHILGLAAFGDLSLSEGYDGWIESEDGRLFWEDDNRFTPVERDEIAEHMVERWRLWAVKNGDTESQRGTQGLD